MRRAIVCLVVVLSSVRLAAAQPAATPEPGGPQTASASPPSPPAPTEAMPSVGSLFTGLGHDVSRLPSTANFLTLFAGGVAAQAVHHEDVSLTARASASVPLDEILDGGARIGGGWVQVGGAVGVYTVGRIMGHVRVAEVGADLVQAQILNTVVTQGIKLAVDRTRPDQSHYSFPSGHTSSTFATAAVLQRQLGWKVGAPAYAMALYVGASRMSENKHFASDVIFGAALGIVAGRTVTVGHGGARFALSPTAVPGGGAVMFSHVN